MGEADVPGEGEAEPVFCADGDAAEADLEVDCRVTAAGLRAADRQRRATSAGGRRRPVGLVGLVLLDTGLFTAQRNRPAHFARVGEATGRRSMTFQELKDIMTEIRGEEPEVADLLEHGNFVVDCVEQRRFIIGRNIEDTVALLHRRAEAIGRCEVPDHHDMGL